MTDQTKENSADSTQVRVDCALGGKTAQQHCEDLKREAKQLLHAEGCSVEAADRIVTCIVMASVLEMSCVQAETMQRLRRA